MGARARAECRSNHRSARSDAQRRHAPLRSLQLARSTARGSEPVSCAWQRTAPDARAEPRVEHDEHPLVSRFSTTSDSATCRRPSISRPTCRAQINTPAPTSAGFEETARPGVGGSFPDFSWSGYTAMNGSAFDQRAEDPGPEGLGGDRQPHLDQGPPHPEVRRQVPPLGPALHRQQAVRGAVELRRIDHPESGEPGRHRRCLRRLPPRLSAAGHARISGRHVRRAGELLARLRAGRLQGLESPHSQRRPALRVLAVALRISRPARHLPTRRRAADHRRRRRRRPGSWIRSSRDRRRMRSSRTRSRRAARQDCRSPSRRPIEPSSDLEWGSPGSRSENARSCAAATASSTSRRAPAIE